MISVNHDWDDENYQETLESAFSRYVKAAYGTANLNEVQHKEVRQAFFSGIHWLCGRDSYDPYEIQSVLARMLNISLKESETDEEE